MMTRRLLGMVVTAAACVAQAAHAQGRVQVRASYFAESYDFDPGLSYSNVSEYTWPVGLNASVGRFDLALSSGYVIVRLESAVPTQLADQRIAGIIDSEVRLSYHLVPGRVVVFGSGVIPSGIESISAEQISILGALSSDLIGFTATTLGTGGQVGGGVAGAFPVGRFALGVSGTFTNPFGYTPVTGQTNELVPGAEVRVRAGIEGPLGRRTYLRTAVMVAARQQDVVGTQTQNGVGNRFIGYLSLNQGLGPGTATIYAFDVFRADPTLEPTLVGGAVLPRGNLLSVGARYDWGVTLTTTVTPRAEFRVSTAAESETDTKLLLAGRAFRYGLDLRQQIGQSLTAAVQFDGLRGFVVQAGQRVDMKGYRAAVHGEWRP